MSARGWGLIAVAVTLTAVAGTTARAQGSVADAIARGGTGTVRLSFRARAGVCGNGSGNGFSTNDRSWRGKRGEWESECEPGPVRVAVDVEDGKPVALRFYVGGRWGSSSAARDAGTVAAAEAGAYFVQLAERGTGRVAREAIVVATIADSSTPWPALIRIAKDDKKERELRKQAVFWLGQAAGDAVAPLDALARDDDEDIEVRKQAVFALSQRPKDEAVPALLAIARGKGDARIKKTAIFWLGQSGDPRAVAYFEDVLGKTR
ncbi:MAG: HEAT repeat domain-containing protein [Gemmatimonadetes bacterium]|nr:HEAT repeat domain-containing protein [Gemmatimonadota bacterium]